MTFELKATAFDARRTWDRLLAAGYADVTITDPKTGQDHTLSIQIDTKTCHACGHETDGR